MVRKCDLGADDGFDFLLHTGLVKLDGALAGFVDGSKRLVIPEAAQKPVEQGRFARAVHAAQYHEVIGLRLGVGKKAHEQRVLFGVIDRRRFGQARERRPFESEELSVRFARRRVVQCTRHALSPVRFLFFRRAAVHCGRVCRSSLLTLFSYSEQPSGSPISPEIDMTKLNN